MALPTHDELVANLREWRSTATPAQVEEGREWYPSMSILIAEVASDAFDATGDAVPHELAAGVFAAYSQNATWKANVTMATKYLNGSGPFGLKSVVRELEAMEEGTPPEEAIGALKRPDFYRNLTGDMDAVTCDRWHLRAATGRDKVTLTAQVREAVTNATAQVAAEYGESPAECQAVIWCAIRGDGK